MSTASSSSTPKPNSPPCSELPYQPHLLHPSPHRRTELDRAWTAPRPLPISLAFPTPCSAGSVPTASPWAPSPAPPPTRMDCTCRRSPTCCPRDTGEPVCWRICSILAASAGNSAATPAGSTSTTPVPATPPHRLRSGHLTVEEDVRGRHSDRHERPSPERPQTSTDPLAKLGRPSRQDRRVHQAVGISDQGSDQCHGWVQLFRGRGVGRLSKLVARDEGLDDFRSVGSGAQHPPGQELGEGCRWNGRSAHRRTMPASRRRRSSRSRPVRTVSGTDRRLAGPAARSFLPDSFRNRS